MNMDLGESSLLGVREPRLSSPLRKSPLAERRARPRPPADRQQATLAFLASWFANRQSQPLFVVDQRMMVLLVNEAARRLLKMTRTVNLHAGRLAFRSPQHRAELSRLVNQGVDSICFAIRAVGSVGAVRIPGGSSETRLIVISILCDAFIQVQDEILQSKLGLTRAEAKVAVAIFNGSSLVKIARDRGASVNTVKTQARYIFQKCGVHSQVELTRRIGELLSSVRR